MDYNKLIDDYYQGRDENAEILIDCYKEINRLREANKGVITAEEIRCYYLWCLILNDYYFHKNINYKGSFLNADKFKNDVDFLYDRVIDLRMDNELGKEIITTFGMFNKTYTANMVMNGYNAKDLFFFHPYDMSNVSTIVGIKECLSYIKFNILVNEKKYNEAKASAEKGIQVIKQINRLYQTGNKVKNDDLVLDDIIGDLNILIGHRIENGTMISEAFEMASDEVSNTYIYPNIKLLCNYYRTLSDGDYKDYILSLIRTLPFTEDTNKLLDELKNATMLKGIEEACRMYVDSETERELLHQKIEELTSNSEKEKIFDGIPDKYKYINFDNLCDGTKNCVATGDYVYTIACNLENKDGFDFSASILEWCKAVENEYRNKIANPILNNNELLNKLKDVDANKIHMLGSAQRLLNYADTIYKVLYKQMYSGIDLRSFKSLLIQVKNLNEKYRRRSAHSEELKIADAKDCREMVLQSQRILEHMSKIPVYKFYS